ncbi:MAG: Uma2 family endonuclease [Planctomycetes bacterium]|nr:Uma2 family endonuclease [Planctomycetota bacterium]
MATATAVLDREAIHVPASAATLAGFRTWATSDHFPRQGRVSFIRQEIIVDMTPEEIETHIKVKAAISSTLFSLSQKLDLGTFYPDGTLVTNKPADLSTEPDGTFVTWEGFRAGRVRAVPRKDRPGEYRELEGTPNWVLEVVSRSSRLKDTRLLREAYHRAGVPEYWLIDALGRTIDFQMLCYRRSGYVRALARRGWLHSRVFDRDFRLRRRRDPLGFWQYMLEVRP